MESTLFTALTPNEEANLSGGTKKVTKKSTKFVLSFVNAASAKSTVNQVGVGGDATAGNITLTTDKAPIVILKSTLDASATGGSVTNDAVSTAVAAAG